jgi:UDP-glucose:(heptosyl)LPS alpha-1,3-glucosyltransferase
MKVALITENFDTRRGGAERSTFELAHCLCELGAQVTLVAGQITNQDQSNLPFALHPLSLPGITRLSRWRNLEPALASYLARSDFDIVHSMIPLLGADIYQPRGGSIRYSAQRHAHSYSNPWIRRFKQNTAFLNLTRQAQIKSERKLCHAERGPVIAALSQYVKDQFKTGYNLADHRIRVIRNGILPDLLLSEEARQQGENLRQLYTKHKDFTLFVFAAVNFRLKGLGWLMEAARQTAEQLTSSHRDFRILVIGSKNYEKYWQRSNQLGLGERMIFTGATQSMPAVLQMCDAVVLPSYNDACSRLVLEGLAAGKPAITTRFNGACDFLGRGRYGCIIETCDDTEALAQALLQLCRRKNLEQMKRAIQEDKIHEQVSMVRHARELLELYRQIVHNKSGTY